jgi:hypothetical protein
VGFVKQTPKLQFNPMDNHFHSYTFSLLIATVTPCTMSEAEYATRGKEFLSRIYSLFLVLNPVTLPGTGDREMGGGGGGYRPAYEDVHTEEK